MERHLASLRLSGATKLLAVERLRRVAVGVPITVAGRADKLEHNRSTLPGPLSASRDRAAISRCCDPLPTYHK